MRAFLVVLVFFLIGHALISASAKSVLKDKKRDQVKLDKEVLLEDEDYEDDPLDLEPEEQKKRLRSLVEKKIDVNKDGYVDLTELKAWSLKAFDKFEIDDLKEEFPMVDLDKDGRISWSEHSKDAFGENFQESDPRVVNPDESNADAMEVAKQFRKDKRLFKVADENQDNYLDFEEYHNFKHPRRSDALKVILIKDKLEHADLDKNEGISLDEFMADEKQGLDEDEKNHMESEEERFQDELDKNDNGLLEGDEIVQWVDPSNEGEADDEADHLMQECDSNGDEKLSVEEIVDNHDIWVESDATDYGRHLMLNHDEF